MSSQSSLTIAAEKWKSHYFPSSISCGIHPWMQAKLFVLGHPYFAISDKEGKIEIPNVPAGKLRLPGPAPPTDPRRP